MYIQSSSLLILSALLTTVTTAAPTPAPRPLRLPFRRIANSKANSHLLNKRDGNLLSSLDSQVSTPLLNDIELYQYGIQVQLGTPGQEFLLLFDTGSSDTWVPSQKCTTDQGCLSGRRYDPAQSSTYQGDQEPVNITYGIGSALGHYFVDRLQAGDQVNLAVPSQTLVKMDVNHGPIAQQKTSTNGDAGAQGEEQEEEEEEEEGSGQGQTTATAPAAATDDTLLDGIFAAGFPAGTLRAQKTGKTYQPFAMSLWDNKVIPAPLFSLTMEDGSTEAASSDWIGQVTFGAVDDSKHTDPIQYTPVLKRNDGVYSHWMATVKGFQFYNGTNTNFRFTEHTHFLIDSGSNFIYLPQGLSDQLAQLISNGAAVWDGTTYTVDCSLMDTPSEQVVNVMFPQETNPEKTFPMPIPISRLVGKNGPDRCMLYFAPSHVSNVFALGNLWLRNFVSVFDFGAYRMGFSPLSSLSPPTGLLSADDGSST